MKIIYFLKKPEYYLNIFNTLRRRLSKLPNGNTTVKTILGTKLFVNTKDSIGLAIAKTGLYDLPVSEVMFRLTDNGDTVLDIGANIGFMTQLMSSRVGITGKVLSFEPNPEILPALKTNIGYAKYPSNIALYELGLSNKSGEGSMVFPDGYANNKGMAQIQDGIVGAANANSIGIAALDDLLEESALISLVKIDAEGYELKILQGASRTLQSNQIKNILYEDFKDYPSDVSAYLLQFDYKIYRIEKGWIGPVLENPFTPKRDSGWDTVNYIATKDEKELMKKFDVRGYQCLL